MATSKRTFLLCGYCGQPSLTGIHDRCYREVTGLAEPKPDQWRQRNLTCHQDLVCAFPPHAGATLARFYHRYNVMAKQTGLPVQFKEAIDQQMNVFKAGLGFDRDRVEVPKTERLPFLDSIEFLGIPLENGPLGPSYQSPPDNDEQVRRKKLRGLEVCPFGLDCRDPRAAVNAVWGIVSIMRSAVELWLEENTPNDRWNWDEYLYEHLANTIELLGLPGHSQFILAISSRLQSADLLDQLNETLF